MRGSRWRLGIALALSLAGVAAVAVTTASGGQAKKPPLIIGYAYDKVGIMSPFDSPALAAAQLEAKKINAHGGVLGRQIVILSCNTQNSKPEVSKSCAANLIGKGAAVGLVTCDVDLATPAVQEFLAKKLLTVAPCIGTDQMGPKRFGSAGKLAFSIGNAAEDEGAAMAEYAFKVKHWKTAITVTDQVIVYFKDIVKAFDQRFTQLGGKIVDNENFTSGDKTITSVVSRVNQHKADVIVTSDGFPDWSTEFSGIRSLGNNTPIMNSWAGDGTFWYPKTTKVSNYWYVTYASVFGDDPNPNVRALIGRLKAAGHPPATGGFVTGAATIDAIVSAIKKAGGSTSGAKLAAIFEKFHNLPTISGGISYSPALHSVFGRQYRVIEVQDSKPKFVQLFKASSPAKF